MGEKIQLYKHLLSLGKSKIDIKELNSLYSPLEIGSKIGVLLDEGLIMIDWDKKIIIIDDLNIEAVLQKKNKISDYSRKVPEYMITEKKDLNKPSLPHKKKK